MRLGATVATKNCSCGLKRVRKDGARVEMVKPNGSIAGRMGGQSQPQWTTPQHPSTSSSLGHAENDLFGRMHRADADERARSRETLLQCLALADKKGPTR
jgi:hypothetical protein